MLLIYKTIDRAHIDPFAFDYAGVVLIFAGFIGTITGIYIILKR